MLNVYDQSKFNIVMSVRLEISNEESRKEGNVLFNDTLNTFYLWLYGIR